MAKVRLTDVVTEAVERLGGQAEQAFSSLAELERLAPPVLAVVRDNAKRRNMSPEAVLKKFAQPVVLKLLGVVEEAEQPEETEQAEQTAGEVDELVDRDLIRRVALFAETVERLQDDNQRISGRLANVETELGELRAKVSPLLLQQTPPTP
jgi:hypothetical protein